MKRNVKGFSLLELLVVILIIGILAAVALPQYYRVVEKTKAAEALTVLKSASQALELYYVVNNSYPNNINELGIEFPYLTGNTRFVPGKTSALSNEDWSLTYEKSTSGYIGLIMGKIKGKYKGACFYSYFEYPDRNVSGRLRCAERISSSNYIFDTNLPNGSYCEKVIGATYESETIYSRTYHLPT